MKKFLALLLTLILILSLTACGDSGSETPQNTDSGESQTNAPEPAAPESGEGAYYEETIENPLEGTEFDMPGLAFGYEMTAVEVVEGAEGDDFDKKITVYYPTPEDAKGAYAIFWQYYYKSHDSNGNMLGFSMAPENMSDTADSFTFFLKYGKAVSEEDAKNLIGKFYLKV